MSTYNEDEYYRIVGKNSVRRIFTIPVGNMTSEEAEKELKKLMADYKEPIDIISDPYSTYTHPVIEPILLPVEKKKSWFRKLFS